MKYDGLNELVVLAAFRYACGRQTYIVSVIQTFLLDVWPDLSEEMREVIKRDIREAAERGEPNSGYSGLGSVRLDEPGWRMFLDL